MNDLRCFAPTVSYRANIGKYYVSRKFSTYWEYLRQDGSWHSYMMDNGGTYFDTEHEAQAALTQARLK